MEGSWWVGVTCVCGSMAVSEKASEWMMLGLRGFLDVGKGASGWTMGGGMPDMRDGVRQGRSVSPSSMVGLLWALMVKDWKPAEPVCVSWGVGGRLCSS